MLSASLSTIAALATVLTAIACLGPASSGAGNPGVSADEILFGQSAVLSGPSQEFGKGMKLGIETAFHEVN